MLSVMSACLSVFVDVMGRNAGFLTRILRRLPMHVLPYAHDILKQQCLKSVFEIGFSNWFRMNNLCERLSQCRLRNGEWLASGNFKMVSHLPHVSNVLKNIFCSRVLPNDFGRITDRIGQLENIVPSHAKSLHCKNYRNNTAQSHIVWIGCHAGTFYNRIVAIQTSQTMIHFISRVKYILIGVETDEKLSKSLVTLIKIINFTINHQNYTRFWLYSRE